MNSVGREVRAAIIIGVLGVLLIGGALQAQVQGGSDPVLFLQSYFDTLNQGDYAAAYAAWVTPPGGATLDAFARGYADTTRISAFVRLPLVYEGAAGSTYAQAAALVVGVQRDGTQRVFTGCYTLQQSNVTGGNPDWRLFGARLAPQTRTDLSTLSSACDRNTSLGAADNVTINQTSPSDLLSAYFDAIVRQDYSRAYAYWETPPQNQSLTQFSAGFANTAAVQVYLRLAAISDAGAGNVYTQLPTILSVSLRSGGQQSGQQFFAGCYTAHRTNVPVGNNPTPDPNWFLAEASVQAATSLANAASRSASVCAAG